MQKSKLQVFLLLFFIVGFTFGQPTITVQPQDQTVTVGETATFSLTATGQGALIYQWYEDGISIGGANTNTYTTDATVIGDDGKIYYCQVFDSTGFVESNNVSLSVNFASGRITDQLQVLYNFNEGSGTTINDVSEVGEPLDLTIVNNIGVNWTDNGLNISDKSVIKSSQTADKIYNACTSSNEITVEAWLMPSKISHTYYKRILTVGNDDQHERNFGFFQKNDTIFSFLRSSSTNLGGEPYVVDITSPEPMHFVYTRNNSGQVKTYIDGTLTSETTVSGDFSNWDSNYYLSIGNEVTKTSLFWWEGTFYQLAIYSKGLSSAEVQQNFNTGVTLDNYPIVLRNPEDQFSSSGETATFSVVAIGPNISYQWRKNGVNISEANEATYTTPILNAGDDNSIYSCYISSSDGNVTSSSATLSVLITSERITDGAIAIYNFTEGQGSVIHDYSGVSTLLNLNISDTNDVEWSQNGLTVTDAANIISDAAATKIYNNATSNNEFSIELWIKPQSAIQEGPARIFSMSQDASFRNFTIAQDSNRYEFRLRTDATDDNGNAIYSSIGSVENKLQHVVATVSGNNVARIYVNGVEQFNKYMGTNLSTWSDSYRLSLANEILDSRPWLGTINYAVFFDRVLLASEVEHNYQVGAYNVGALEAPTSLVVSEPIVGRISLSWEDNSTYEDGFIVERSTLDTLHYEVLGTVQSNQSLFTDTTANEGTSYYYRVKGFNNFTGMNSDYSNEENFISNLKVATNLELDAAVLGEVNVSWVDNSHNEDGYVLERGKGDPIAYVRLDSLSGTTYVDETVEEGVEYTYRVKAYNEIIESAYSETATIITKASFVNTPTDLVIELDAVYGVPVLTWTDNAFNETGYIVERRSIVVGAVFSVVDSLEADEVTYTDDTVSDSTAYVYRVYAYNDEYTSDYSGEVFVQVVVGVEGFGEVPNEFSLAQNFPNPFNPSTTIRFGLPKSAEVTLKLYNLLGQELYTIVNQSYSAGTYSVDFDASRLSSGIYVYSIVANSGDKDAFVQSKKMILLK